MALKGNMFHFFLVTTYKFSKKDAKFEAVEANFYISFMSNKIPAMGEISFLDILFISDELELIFLKNKTFT